MSFEFSNAIRNDVMYTEHRSNIISFLMDLRT